MWCSYCVVRVWSAQVWRYVERCRVYGVCAMRVVMQVCVWCMKCIVRVWSTDMLVACIYVGIAYGVCFAGVECMGECGVCFAGVECSCWYHVCMLVSYVYVLRHCVWCEV